MMLKQLLSTTALVLALSAPAWAQTSDDAGATGQGQTTEELNAQTTDQPAGATDDAAGTAETQTQTEEPATGTAETAPAPEEPATGTAETPPAPEEPATGTAETEPPAEEPATGTAETEAPAAGAEEAVIAEQKEGQMKAEDLMGMTVLSGEGEEIGEVQDLIFDQNEQIAGVVVGIGGFLGIGQKRVALNWQQAEVQQNPDTGEEVILVNLTKEELEAAPEFKTTEEQQAEEEAAQQQMQGGGVTGTAPGTGGLQ